MTPAATPPPSGSTGFAGAIFDVDGVLVDSPHEAAWRRALHELMVGEWSGIRDATTWSPEAFTPQVYQRVLSGKPRLSGARAAGSSVFDSAPSYDSGTKFSTAISATYALMLPGAMNPMGDVPLRGWIET